MRRLCAYLVLLGTLVSCQSHYCPPNYVEEAYLEQKAAFCESLNPRLDEISNEELVIQLEDEACQEWRQRSYESIDQWLARLEAELHCNNYRIKDLKEELESLESEERDYVNRIQTLLKRNEQLRNDVQSLQHEVRPKKDGMTSGQVPPPPFNIHLVRRGDTLFSIAMRYYGTGQKIPEILRWNQGWVRHADDIKAGIPLILFDENAPETSKRTVDQYLKRVDAVLQRGAV